MKNLTHDISGVIIYFFIAFIVCSAVITMIFFLIYIDEIYYLHSTDSSFQILKYILYKIRIIVFYFIPIVLITSVVSGFSIAKNLDFRLLGSYIAFFIFILTIFILIYLIFFVQQNRISIIENAYIPKYNKQISNLYDSSLVSFNGLNVYFRGNAATYYKNGFIKSVFSIDLKNNRIVMQNDFQNGKNLKYIPYPESVAILKIFKPLQIKYKYDFLVFMQFIEKRPIPYYFIYLFSLLCALSLLPVVLYKKSWNFSTFAFKILLTAFYIFLLALSYQYMRKYLSDLRLKYSILLYFPALVMVLITFLETIIIIAKEQKKNFVGIMKRITSIKQSSNQQPYGDQ